MVGDQVFDESDFGGVDLSVFDESIQGGEQELGAWTASVPPRDFRLSLGFLGVAYGFISEPGSNR